MMLKNIIMSEINKVATIPIDADFPCSQNLIEAGLIDSMQFLDLVAALEEATGIEIDFLEVDPATITSIEGLIAIFGAD